MFFNAIGVEKFSGSNYKKIIEKYAIFEHLTYDDLTKHEKNIQKNSLYEIRDLVNIILPTYHQSAFGKNEKLVQKLNELKKDNKTE